ncbi:MAG: galactose mutarotase [Clostridia bacterium]|nr:galactose mutarotase [Clostridia bacterium]
MKKEVFGKVDGKEVYKYTLTGDNVSVDVLDFGATIQSLYVDGINVVQSFETAEDYKLRDGYVCGAIGRVANRIAKAKFTLNGQEYKLTKNEGDNQLHGGLQGFHHKFYEVEEIKNGVKMTCISLDGEDGYPGRLVFTIEFTLTGRTLHIEYSAISDKDTIWAPTHHFYFNMNGPIGYANSNQLTIYADTYTPVDKELIPLGYKADVTGTPFDFRKGKRIGQDKTELGIYDHNFMLNSEHAATMVGDISGLKMEVYTDMPAIQMYTGAGKEETRNAEKISDRGGVALEPQFAPNAINMEGFDKPILKANEEKRHYIQLAF